MENMVSMELKAEIKLTKMPEIQKAVDEVRKAADELELKSRHLAGLAYRIGLKVEEPAEEAAGRSDD